MPRITTVQKARAVPGLRRCGRCGKDIVAGEKYYHWSNRAPGSRGGHKSIRCADHYPRPSEYTGSPYVSAACAAQESVDDFLAGEWEPTDLAEELRSAAESIRNECAEPLREGAQNIEDGFGHETYQSSEMNERADAFEEWADEIESAADEIDALTPEECEHEQEVDDIRAEHEACAEDAECDHEETADNLETEHEDDCGRDVTDEARDLAESTMAQCPE